MKVLLLDADQAHNKKIELALGQDSKTQIHAFARLEPLLEVLNGNPALEQKQRDLEKASLDATAMAKKMSESLEELKNKIATKKTELQQLQDTNSHEEAKKAAQEVGNLESQYSKGEEVRTKAEAVLHSRQAELEHLKATAPKPEEKKASLVLVDRSFLGNTPVQWITDFRNGVSFAANKNVPVVVMGYNEDIDYIKKTLVQGVSDYFVKPVDILMLKHNSLKIAGEKVEGDSKVYELQVKSELKILRLGTTTKMSEFELDVQTDNAFGKDEIVEFYADVFSGQKGGRILGRCLKCEADATEKGKHISSFTFVGLSPHTMNEMRKWLKLQYVNSKNKG